MLGDTRFNQRRNSRASLGGWVGVRRERVLEFRVDLTKLPSLRRRGGSRCLLSADGVVLSSPEISSNLSPNKGPENHPPAEAGPLLRKEGSFVGTGPGVDERELLSRSGSK